MFRNNRPLKVLNRCSAIRCSLRSSMFNPLAHQSDVVFTHQPVNPPNLDIVDRFKTVEEGARSGIPTQLWGGAGGGGFRQRRRAGDMFCLSICTCCTFPHTPLRGGLQRLGKWSLRSGVGLHSSFTLHSFSSLSSFASVGLLSLSLCPFKYVQRQRGCTSSVCKDLAHRPGVFPDSSA